MKKWIRKINADVIVPLFISFVSRKVHVGTCGYRFKCTLNITFYSLGHWININYLRTHILCN